MIDDINDIIEQIARMMGMPPPKELNKNQKAEMEDFSKLFDIASKINSMGAPEGIKITVDASDPKNIKREISGNIEGLDEIKKMFGFGQQAQDHEVENRSKIDKEIYDNIVKMHDKNLKLIERIVQMCCQQKITDVIVDQNIDFQETNCEILKQFNYSDLMMNKIFETYRIDLEKIKNIKKFLMAVKYAIDRKQLIIDFD